MINRGLAGRVVTNVTRSMAILAARFRPVPRFDEGMQRDSRAELAYQLAVVDEVARTLTSTLEIEQAYGEFAQQLGELADFD